MGDYPEWTDAGGVPEAFVYMKNLVARPSGDRFAALYANFRKIRIFDGKGGLEKEIDVTFPEAFPEYTSDRAGRYLAYASYPFADDNLVYALCRNCKASDRPAVTEVQVWNREGELVRRLVFDRYFDIFTIDPSTKTLFAVDSAVGDEIIVASLGF